MKNTFQLLCCLSLCIACKPTTHETKTAPTNASTTYKTLSQIHLEGDGFWDYLSVDTASNRLYVSHGAQVQIVDLASGKQVGAILNTEGVHGIAIAPDLGKGFASCGRDASVVVFDLKTLATTDKIKVTGENPDAILYDAFSKRVFAFNHSGKNVTVIDASTNKVVGTIPMDGELEFATTDGQGTIYTNIEDKSEIAAFDAQTLKVTHVWPIAPGEEPTGLAIDVKNMRLFTVCGNQKMVVLDAHSGNIIQTLPIGDGCDGVAFDPGTKRIYSSNGEGTMTVVEQKTPDQYAVVATVPTQKGARTITVNPKTHRLYLPAAEREPTVGDARPKVRPGTFVVLEVEGM